MTAAAHPTDNRESAPLGGDRTRIHISAAHRPLTKRPLKLTDALDFWAFAGAAANVAMQMARPGVGYGVAQSKVESGSLMKHPWKRARTTTQYLAVAILGTEEERKAYREAVNAVHRHVRSEPGAPVKYNAFDRDLQMWVAACLFIGFEDTYQLLHGRMNEEQAEAFYASSSTLGTTLQVTEEMWPATRKDFDAYWNAACEQAVMDDYVRAYVDDLLNLRMIHWYLRIPFRGLLKFLTIGFLAPHFREQMQVKWTEADQRRFEHLFVFVGFVNRFIPRPLRFGGTYTMMADIRRRLKGNKQLV
ncbi:oxygenase MpaB family protein [Nocardia takedensis]|uniref:oxygenase MpaB family protein n=1 Tax=Nocardia takedensis TaxID=259390 RepID=UPI00031B7122|nr:oxygenase MpaB family protein [Nocardia takedensis]